MRYRISTAQIKMLLAGKSLEMGNGRRLILPEYSDLHKQLSALSDSDMEKIKFFTDGVTLFVEGKHGK